MTDNNTIHLFYGGQKIKIGQLNNNNDVNKISKRINLFLDELGSHDQLIKMVLSRQDEPELELSRWVGILGKQNFNNRVTFELMKVFNDDNKSLNDEQKQNIIKEIQSISTKYGLSDNELYSILYEQKNAQKISYVQVDEKISNEIINSIDQLTKKDIKNYLPSLSRAIKDFGLFAKLLQKSDCVHIGHILKFNKLIENKKGGDEINNFRELDQFSTKYLDKKKNKIFIVESFKKRDCSDLYSLVELLPEIYEFRDFSVFGKSCFDVLDSNGKSSSLLFCFSGESMHFTHNQYFILQLSFMKNSNRVVTAGIYDEKKGCVEFITISRNQEYMKLLVNYCPVVGYLLKNKPSEKYLSYINDCYDKMNIEFQSCTKKII